MLKRQMTVQPYNNDTCVPKYTLHVLAIVQISVNHSTRGYHTGYLIVRRPMAHLWLTRGVQGIATSAVFSRACPVVAFRSTHTHMGGVLVLSRTCWGGSSSNGAYRNRAATTLPEQETALTP
jgi:hypothetical protein